jgi:hypothetical protein
MSCRKESKEKTETTKTSNLLEYSISTMPLNKAFGSMKSLVRGKASKPKLKGGNSCSGKRDKSPHRQSADAEQAKNGNLQRFKSPRSRGTFLSKALSSGSIPIIKNQILVKNDVYEERNDNRNIRSSTAVPTSCNRLGTKS